MRRVLHGTAAFALPVLLAAVLAAVLIQASRAPGSAVQAQRGEAEQPADARRGQAQDQRPQRGPQDQPRDEQPPGEAREQAIERGRYLVHHVAMCVICHSPQLPTGEIDTRRLLHGGRIPVRSPFPAQEWAFSAPRLAGLPGGWTEDRLITLLTTGRRPDGPPPRPPMPPYRLTREDAAAVAAYLRSLP